MEIEASESSFSNGFGNETVDNFSSMDVVRSSGCVLVETEVIFLVVVAVALVAAEGDVGLFLMDNIQHLEQHPPVASAPKNPQPFLHGVETFVCCSLMVVIFLFDVSVIEIMHSGFLTFPGLGKRSFKKIIKICALDNRCGTDHCMSEVLFRRQEEFFRKEEESPPVFLIISVKLPDQASRAHYGSTNTIRVLVLVPRMSRN